MAENSSTRFFDGIGKAHDGTGLYVTYATAPGQIFLPGTDDGTSIIEKRESGGLGNPIWSQEFPRKFVVGNPLVIGHTVYVAYNGYTATHAGLDVPQTQAGILVLQADDGAVLADHPLHIDEVGPLTSSNGYLLAVTDHSMVTALKLPGLDKAWEWRSSLEIGRTPAVDQGIVVVPQWYETTGLETLGGLTALDLKTGDVKWTAEVPNSLSETPAILGPMVYFQDGTGTISALSLNLGLLMWSAPAEPSGIPIAVRDGLLVTRYVDVEENRSRAGNIHFQSYIRGWDPLTGKPLWTWKVSTTGSVGGGIALADRYLYFPLGDPGGKSAYSIGCLDLETLQPAWIVDQVDYSNQANLVDHEGPIMAAGRVFLTNLAVDAGAEPVEGPHAAIAEAPRSMPANQPLHMRDGSTPGTRPIKEWHWSLVNESMIATYPDSWRESGGIHLSTDRHPDHRGYYRLEPGNYTLILRVWDDQGRLGTATQPMEILPPVEYTPPVERGLAGQTALFTLAALAVVAIVARRLR